MLGQLFQAVPDAAGDNIDATVMEVDFQTGLYRGISSDPVLIRCGPAGGLRFGPPLCGRSVLPEDRPALPVYDSRSMGGVSWSWGTDGPRDHFRYGSRGAGSFPAVRLFHAACGRPVPCTAKGSACLEEIGGSKGGIRRAGGESPGAWNDLLEALSCAWLRPAAI